MALSLTVFLMLLHVFFTSTNNSRPHAERARELKEKNLHMGTQTQERESSNTRA